jgi:MFS family permease
MLALVWLVYACFGITTGSIPPLVTTIMADLSITSGQMGLILGAWQFVYILTASPLGAMVDRFGAKRSIGVGVLVILASLVLRGLAVDFWTLLLTVGMFGIGGPIISIGAPKVTAQWFRGNERGVAAGIYATGPWAGMAFALATAAGFIVPLTGSWRGISVVYGCIVLVVAVAWWLLAKEAPESMRDEEPQGERTPAWTVTKELLRIRNVQVVLVLAVGAFLANHALTAWMPTLLEEGDFTPSKAGSWVALSLVGSVIGQMFIPPLAKAGRRVLTLGVLFSITAATTLAMAFLAGPALISVVVVSGGFRSPIMSVMTLVLMETRGIGARRMGAGAGLFFAAAEIGGFSGPLILGLMRDASGNLISGMMLMAGVSVAMLVALPLIKESTTPKVPAHDSY